MTLPNNEIAGIGMGFGVGAGVTMINVDAGLGIGVFGIGMVLLAIKRDRAERPDDDDESDDQEMATDGGTVRRETPRTAAPEQPTVLEVDVVGDRMLASAEKGDVSVVVEAPAGTSQDELEATLDDVPKRIERTAELFAGGDE